MLRRVTALLILSLWPEPGQAGAWLRDEGSVFAAFSITPLHMGSTGTANVDVNTYVEYGLRPKLTLGFSGSYSHQLGGSGTVFLRIPLINTDKPAKLSAEFGLGARVDLLDFEPFFKTGVSWGRGLSFGDKSGWVNIDAATLWSLGSSPDQLKIDATLGAGLTDRVQIMGQVFFEGDRNDSSVTLASSVIVAIGKKRKTRFVAGLEHRTGRRASTGLKIGLWRDFRIGRKANK